MYRMHRDAEIALRTIFKRCVECDDAPLVCPECDDGTTCSYTVGDCNTCPSKTCVPVDQVNMGANEESTGEQSEGPNIGAIAGGVIGGVAFIIIATYLIWRFCIKKRRQELDESEWDRAASGLGPEKRQSDFTMRRDARNSTHTVHSLASTVLTRASNIIQIAYIPGITNRSGPQSPDLLVPPVPPIPIALNNSAPSSPYSHTEDSHYFMPGDLRSVRESAYSGYSDDNRSSFHTIPVRNSITPSLARSSVATTIYRNDAVVNPMPAQTIVRGKAAMVSVKPSGSPLGTPTNGTPPVPSIDYGKIERPQVNLRLPSNKSPRAESPNSLISTATTAKPVPVTISKKKPSLISMNSSSSLSSTTRPTTSSSAADSDILNIRNSDLTEIADTPGFNQSPFADMSATISSPAELNYRRSVSRVGGLDPVVESDESKGGSAQIQRSRSPFGDEHEVK